MNPFNQARSRMLASCLVATSVAALITCDGRHAGSANAATGAPLAASASGSGETTSTSAPLTVDGARPLSGLPDFAVLADRLVPAVVSIETEQRVHVSGRGERPFGGSSMDPFDLFRFFGEKPPRDFENRGLGTGFVIEGNGLILTNEHVVEKADSIKVTFTLADGSEKSLKAKIVGEAPEYDVALIQTEEDAKASVVPLGDSDTTRIGDWVMAVGNPFGLTHSVSVGIVSAKERRELAPSGRRGLYNFIQTDASINPGNSGGPLVNLRGEVIGINSAINAQGQGIGFAIPINMVKTMLPQLKKGGKFVRSWVGVKIQGLSDELAQSYGFGSTQGVLVAEVVKGGPGEKAGLKEGDIITEFDGKKLHRSSDLPLYASMTGVGKKVSVSVWRDRKVKKLDIELQAFPEDGAEVASSSDGGGNVETPMGLGLVDLRADIREQLGVGAQRGAVVEMVEPGSAAGKAGLVRGDVIVSINGEDVSSARDAIRLIKGSGSGEVIRLRVERQGGRSFIALRKP